MPNKSIESLLGTINNMAGVQRSNQYVVYITPPSELETYIKDRGSKDIRENMQQILTDNDAGIQKYIASSVQIPASVIQYFEDNMAPSGNYVAVPVKRQFDNTFKIDFIVDGNWNIRKFFEDWVDLIFNRLQNSENRNNSTVSYYDDIVGTVQIDALSVNGAKAKTIWLYGAYPATIMPSVMSHDLQSNYFTFSVDINYRNYDIERKIT